MLAAARNLRNLWILLAAGIIMLAVCMAWWSKSKDYGQCAPKRVMAVPASAMAESESDPEPVRAVEPATTHSAGSVPEVADISSGLMPNENIAKTLAIEEKPLAPEDTPSEVQIVFQPPKTTLSYVEHLTADSGGGEHVVIHNKFSCSLVGENTDGSFEFDKAYNYILLNRGGKDIQIDPRGTASARVRLATSPNGRTWVTQYSTKGGSPTSVGAGQTAMQPEFPQRPLKAKEQWEWSFNGTPVKAQVQSFVNVQGRRCAKVSYASTGPIVMNVQYDKRDYRFTRQNCHGEVYIDFDTGQQVAQKYYEEVEGRSIWGVILLETKMTP